MQVVNIDDYLFFYDHFCYLTDSISFDDYDVIFLGNVTIFLENLNSTDLLENPVFTNESCSKTGGAGACEFGLENSFQVWSTIIRYFERYMWNSHNFDHYLHSKV